ncbi:MAG: PAS domain-containing protein [Chloroflexi bacterium]|nr:PAS domain-containing protein [Chloroflexota bacterium]
MSTSIRVLHVDDSALDRELIRDALEHDSADFTVITASARQEFEHQLARGEFDVVVTDFNILGFEGVQVIDAVHSHYPHLPVIVVTGTGSEEVAVEAMKRGAADYVIKSPRHIRRLATTIQSACERKRLLAARLQAESNLRRSEERLSAFAEALPDLAFILDEDGRLIQLLNDPQMVILPEHQLGRPIDEVFPSPAADLIMDAIRQTVATGYTQQVEYQLEVAQATKWYDGRTALMGRADGGKQLIVYIARDITDRKEAEFRLRRERNLLRTLIDNVPDYIFVKDRSDRFIASNLAHAAVARSVPADLIGREARDVFDSDFVESFHADDAVVMARGTAIISEERVMHDQAGPHWTLTTKVPFRSDEGEVIGLVGIARDITARKQAIEALRASEEHLQMVIKSNPVILFEVDPQGVLKFLQGRGSQIVGQDMPALVGLSIVDAFEPLIPDIRGYFQRALSGEETGTVLNIANRILDIRYSTLQNKTGENNGIIGVVTDITERIRADRLQIELEKEQEIIHLKEQLISTISHDFRTPLSIIKMNVTMLETYAERFSAEQRAIRIQQIYRQIQRMVALLDDVLTLSKANAGKLVCKPEPVALKQLCMEIWDNFQHMAGKTHVIDFVYNADSNEVMLDQHLVHDILVNLLSNAVKYSQVNGHVHFEVARNGNDIEFRIADNGIGIPEAEQVKLFEPFHRASNTGRIEGTGLGLSIVKSYVDAHHGQIEFTSKEGEGTCFTVTIPCTGR